MQKECSLCHKPFEAKNDREKFCHRPLELTCKTCGNKFYKTCCARQAQLLQKYCSKHCVFRDKEKLAQKIATQHKNDENRPPIIWPLRECATESCKSIFRPTCNQQIYCEYIFIRQCQMCGKPYRCTCREDQMFCSAKCRKADPIISKQIKEATTRTLTEKYSTNGEIISNPFQSEIIKKRIKETNLQRYGCEMAVKSRLVADKVSSTKGGDGSNRAYGGDRTGYRPDLPSTPKEPYKKLYGCQTSKGQYEVFTFLREEFPFLKIKMNERSILNPIRDQIREHYAKVQLPQEIDIYLPELKLGIEYNGVYYHNRRQFDSNYWNLEDPLDNEIELGKDFLKGILSLASGALETLSFIWEDDWYSSQKEVKCALDEIIREKVEDHFYEIAKISEAII